MRRVLVIIIAVLIALTATAAPASAKTTDRAIVKAYCMKTYHKPPRYFKAGSKAITHRAGKKYIVVEVIRTTSRGKWGKTKDGYRVAYNKRVKRGKKVTVYAIYSPGNNAEDDVVAVVDNKRIR